MVSTTLLVLLIASIAVGNPTSDEIVGPSADRQSYLASAIDFVQNVGLSIGLTRLLFSGRPRDRAQPHPQKLPRDMHR